MNFQLPRRVSCNRQKSLATPARILQHFPEFAVMFLCPFKDNSAVHSSKQGTLVISYSENSIPASINSSCCSVAVRSHRSRIRRASRRHPRPRRWRQNGPDARSHGAARFDAAGISRRVMPFLASLLRPFPKSFNPGMSSRSRATFRPLGPRHSSGRAKRRLHGRMKFRQRLARNLSPGR